MARQTGIIGIQGTVGGLVFNKNGSISQKPQGNKAAFASAPSRARTRENAAEFGQAAKYSKVLRDALRVAIASASDSRVAARLTKVMREVIGLDDTSDRGQRVFDAANSAPLLGFDFNAAAGIGQTIGAASRGLARAAFSQRLGEIRDRGGCRPPTPPLARRLLNGHGLVAAE